MAATETITLRLVAQDLMSGNVTKAIGSLDKLAKQGGLVGSVLQGVGQSFGQMLNPVGLVTRGIGMLTDGLADAAKAAMEDQRSVAQLDRTLANNVDTLWTHNVAIDKAIAAAGDLAFADDEVRSSLNALIPRTKDVNEAIRLNALAMDLARFKSISLEDAAGLVGKAYSGQASALKRAGVSIRNTKDSTAALAELQGIVAGQASDYAATTEGSFKALDITLDEMVESLGYELLPTLTDVVKLIRDIVSSTGVADDTAKAWAISLAKANGAGEQTGDWLVSARDGIQALNDILQPQVDEAADFAKSLKAIGDAAGVSDRAIMDMFLRLKDSGLGAEGAKRAVTSYLLGLRDMELGTVSFGKAVLAQMGVAGEVPAGVAAGSAKVAAAVKGTARSVERASVAMFRTMDEAKAPWKQDWADLAAWAKDPFRPKQLEHWIADRAEQATKNAAKAAKDGKPAVARRWREIARAMSDPVLGDLMLIGLGVEDAIAALRGVETAGRKVHDVVTGMFDFGGPDRPKGDRPKGGGKGGQNDQPERRPGDGPSTGTRAMGGPVSPGGTYVVGEHEPETLVMGATGGYVIADGGRRAGWTGGRGGGNVNVTVVWHSPVMPTEAEADRVAARLAPALNRHLARVG